MRKLILLATILAWIVAVSGCQSCNWWPWKKQTPQAVMYGDPCATGPAYLGSPVAAGPCSAGYGSCASAPATSGYQVAAPIPVPGQ